MKLNSIQMRDKIISYLLTIPEIISCKINIDNQDLLLTSINNSNLDISPNTRYFTTNTTNEYFINLIQANIKQSRAIEISTFLNTLFELNSNDCLYESWDEIGLELDKLDFQYVSKC